MQSIIDGNTRIFAILGDPISQVKSPAQVTASLQARSRNALLVPFHVISSDFDNFVRSLKAIRNLDGLVVTVPHKFAAFRHCEKTTSRAAFLEAVNVMRPVSSGTSWEGDMCDGQGFVDAILKKGGALVGKSALLIGAGGAGTAIGYALLEAAVARLSIDDIDRARREVLVEKLRVRFGDRVTAGASDLVAVDVLANATPAGMEKSDEPPIDLDQLRSGMIVGDVVTAKCETTLVEAARSKGCLVSTGHDMYQGLQETMVDFLLSSS